MRRTLSLISLAAAIAMVAATAHATDIGTLLNNKRQPESFNIIRISALVALMHNSDAHAHIFDANHHALRVRAGMIPGARPLTSYDNYNVADELPSNKSAKLVFYCADLH